MFARFVFIAAATTLVSGAALAAEPARPLPQPKAQSQRAPSEVILASADEVRAPSLSEPQTQAAPRHRPARATTCRCGDPQSRPER